MPREHQQLCARVACDCSLELSQDVLQEAADGEPAQLGEVHPGAPQPCVVVDQGVDLARGEAEGDGHAVRAMAVAQVREVDPDVDEHLVLLRLRVVDLHRELLQQLHVLFSRPDRAVHLREQGLDPRASLVAQPRHVVHRLLLALNRDHSRCPRRLQPRVLGVQPKQQVLHALDCPRVASRSHVDEELLLRVICRQVPWQEAQVPHIPLPQLSPHPPHLGRSALCELAKGPGGGRRDVVGDVGTSVVSVAHTPAPDGLVPVDLR
eukprot:766675-Hanusia_phi.AAC.4